MEAALAKLVASAGPKADEALSLAMKILQNILDNPAEPKFRRLNPNSAKLRSALLAFDGALDFLTAAGFVRSGDGTLEAPQSAAKTLIDARGALVRRNELLQRKRQAEQMSSGNDMITAGYRAAVEGGAKGAGHAELKAILGQASGKEALELLERILVNVRRYPDSPKYRCVSLAKSAGQKVLPAAALMQLAGFERTKSESGEDCLRVERPNSDKLERIWAMIWWATRPALPLQLPPPPAGHGATLVDHAFGALLGAAIGDALGASLGGKGLYEVSAEEVDKALEMCGGGIWGVAPGQPTGNTELMICLADSLVEAPDGGKGALRQFPLEDLAVRYGNWGRSFPFRAERACMQAFQRPLPSVHMIENSREVNPKSLGSGALVRCMPLAVLGAVHGAPSVAGNLACQDAELSHPSTVIGVASAAFVVASSSLISTSGDRSAALSQVKQWAKREHEASAKGMPSPVEVEGPQGWTHLSSGVQERIQNRQPGASEKWTPPGDKLVACEQVSGWITTALSGTEQLPFSDLSAGALLNGEVGSVEIPLMHAFRHLQAGSTMETAMRAVLAGGGDASTNAMVVGGLLGAAHGLQALPERWVQAVLASDPSEGVNRPTEYRADRLPALLKSLVGT